MVWILHNTIHTHSTLVVSLKPIQAGGSAEDAGEHHNDVNLNLTHNMTQALFSHNSNNMCSYLLVV